MPALVIGFICLLAFIGFANKEAGKLMLGMSWLIMVLFAVGSFALGVFIPAFR